MSVAQKTATPTVVRDIVDSADERELWIVGREFERPPYFHAGKGGDTRLARALRLCVDEKITPNSDGSYQVQGSEGRSYRVAESCSCPNSQKASSRWCYHAVGVALYVEWRKRCAPAPVVLGTLRAGTAPLRSQVPATPLAEEQAEAWDLATRIDDDDTLGNGYPIDDATLPLPLGPTSTDERLAAVPAPTMPQEARMPADEYIPEPDDADAPVAVADAPEPPPPAPVKIPREFTVDIKGKTHVLYTGLVIAARHDGLVSLSADWTYNDAELSLAHAVCTFADGRRYEESGDASPSNVSKGISLHFRRVALTRAKARCLRDALGISECSVEEMEDDGGKREAPVMTPPTDQEYRQRIWAKVKELRPETKTRSEVEMFVKGCTGLELHEDNYRQILERLERK